MLGKFIEFIKFIVDDSNRRWTMLLVFKRQLPGLQQQGLPVVCRRMCV